MQKKSQRVMDEKNKQTPKLLISPPKITKQNKLMDTNVCVGDSVGVFAVKWFNIWCSDNYRKPVLYPLPWPINRGPLEFVNLITC